MKLTPQQVLWPTDFSTVSLHAGRYARAFQEHFDCQLHILHVIPPPVAPHVPATIPPELPSPVTDPGMLDSGRQNLMRLVNELFGTQEKMTCEVQFGNPWTAVCDYARDHKVDLIVLSTHGRTGLAHALIGSTAERVVQHAPCPVFTVKLKQQDFVQD